MKGNFRLAAKGVLGQGKQNFDPLVSENVRSLMALPVDLRLPGVSQRARRHFTMGRRGISQFASGFRNNYVKLLPY